MIPLGVVDTLQLRGTEREEAQPDRDAEVI